MPARGNNCWKPGSASGASDKMQDFSITCYFLIIVPEYFNLIESSVNAVGNHAVLSEGGETTLFRMCEIGKFAS